VLRPARGGIALAPCFAALLGACAAFNAEVPPRPGEVSYGNDFVRVCWSPVETAPDGGLFLRSLRVNERGGAELRGVELFGWVDADKDGVIDENEKKSRFETHASARDTFLEFGEVRIAEASSAKMMLRVDHSAGEPLELSLSSP
jgi:hypothetical protein